MSCKYNKPLLDQEVDDEIFESPSLLLPHYHKWSLKVSLVINTILLVTCLLLSGSVLFLSSPEHCQRNTLIDDIAEPYRESSYNDG
jgi:hypothetical protein